MRAVLSGQPPDTTPYSGDPPALAQLAHRFELTSFERDLIVLCTALTLEPSAGSEPLTFRHAMTRLAEPHLDALSPSSPLRMYRLVVLAGDDPLGSPLVLDERVLYFLLGIPAIDQRLAPHLTGQRSDPTPLVPTLQRVADDIARELTTVAPGSVIQVFGSSASARAEVVDAAARAANLVPMRLRASTLPSAAADLELLARASEREMHLAARLLVVEVDDDDPTQLRLRTMCELNRGVIIATAREPIALNPGNAQYEVPHPTIAERRQMWCDALASDASRVEPMLDRLALQFSLEPQQIARVVQAATRGKSADLANALWSRAAQQSRPRLEGLATRVEPAAEWSDLVVPPQIDDALHEICDQLRHRHRVHEQWGLARRGRRGTAITALFHGPSGTGKTLAAEVIARETGLDLYHVDLSQIVDKYVGETEKRLRRIFDAADQAGAILLFDEADALFGKRGEVESGTDRWANLEVSYLLQRMETYRGLAILTTNMKAALDQAFLRRLRFVLAFPFPDVALRSELWRRAFPSEAPIAVLDPTKLARLQLTGANIHGVALRAAFYAARDGGAITTAHVVRAARGEFAKLEKPFPEAEILSWGEQA